MVENAGNRPLRVVAVCGSLHAPSKTSVLVSAILDAIAEHQEITRHVIELSDIGPEFAGALTREQVAPSVEEELRRIEDADLLVVVDFNRAYLPPCAFSDFYVCPLPPAGNRLSTPIRAGEKNVILAS